MAAAGGELYCIRPIDDQESKFRLDFELSLTRLRLSEAYRTITTLLGMMFTRSSLIES